MKQTKNKYGKQGMNILKHEKSNIFLQKANYLLFKKHLTFVTIILLILKHPWILVDCLCNFNPQGQVFLQSTPLELL